MQYPKFHHSALLYNLWWITLLPVLIDICTACTLFSFWLVWLFFSVFVILSVIRLVHGFKQKCYKFSFSLLGVITVVGGILMFFQLSFNHVILTPLSHQVKKDVLEVDNPIEIADSQHNALHHDSLHKIHMEPHKAATHK